MILVSTYYKSKNEERNKELEKCLYKNYENRYIEKIYLLNDKIYDLPFIDKKKKIIQYVINEDPTYKLKYNDAIQFINEHLNNKICILSNSDIYFNNTLSKINNKIINNNFFALLRYDEDYKGFKHIFSRFNEPRNDAQDCWIFRAPLDLPMNKLDFSLGTLGCDNMFATIVHESKINISNPSLDIIITHVHNSGIRTYDEIDRIYGKYTFLVPCKLGIIPKVVFYDYIL